MRLLTLCSMLLCGVDLTLAQTSSPPLVHMLVPGFKVEELPLKLSNQNNIRFAPDGTLTSLGYDGKVWRLRDTDGDGLEDLAEPFWSKTTLSVPLGMAWSTHGLFVSSKGKVSLLKDSDHNGVADGEEIIASGWPVTDVGSGGVDASAVTLDSAGNVYFGLLVADYSNGYRLRKRKDLKPQEIDWLKQNGRWRESQNAGAADDLFSLYDTNSVRGTIQKWDAQSKKLSTLATGIRVPVALAFNSAGDLFNTDQEGETWMPNGNPRDELNHIISGRNYGFPPAQAQWLPGLVSEPPVVAFGPQHQSACGLVFNEPHPALNANGFPNAGKTARPAAPAQGLFGPRSWKGNAFVAGESRGRIWRAELFKTDEGYVGRAQTIARLSMLTIDVAISPGGALYVCCQSGNPDWGTGPQGMGKIFKITYIDPKAPVPQSVWPASPTEVHVTFEQPLHSDVPRVVTGTNAMIEFGEYVSAGDRFEKLKPPYAVVQQQGNTPRGKLNIRGAQLQEEGRTLVLKTDPHPFLTHYSVTLAGIKGAEQSTPSGTIDLDYDLTQASQPVPAFGANISRKTWNQPVAWAPKTLASSGTDSHAGRKPDGDWEHGRELFFGAQLQCAKCHRVRGQGGTAGPDLSNLIHRDASSVLRDIREPSATLHPDYVTYQITTKDNDVIQGFIRSQKQEEIRLFDVDGKETVLMRTNIADLRPTELSLMPAGLLDGRKAEDVRDLLTFLLWEPPKRSIESTKALLGKGASVTAQKTESNHDLRLILVASKQDHGPGQHDYPNWQTNWSRLFTSAGKGVAPEMAWEWPSAAQFDSARVIVFYFWNHKWSAERLAQLDAFLARGGGIVLLHSAVIADSEPEVLANRIGLSAHPRRTGYRHMPFELRFVDREHPVTRGLPERIDLIDEPYWPLIGKTNDANVLASARIDGQSRPLIWTREVGKGRIFASIPSHYTWTLDDPLFRVVILRGIAWAAGEPPAQLQSLAFENEQ